MQPDSTARRPGRLATGLLCTCLTALAATGCGAGSSDPHEPRPSATGERISLPGEASSPIQTVVPVTLTPAPRPTGPLPPDAGCVTAACHAALSRARYVHGAVSPGDCFVCHEPDEGGHVYPLLRPGNDGCTFCHAVTGNRTHQHAANDAPGCTACHRPHTSNTKFLLTAPTVEMLCAQCHVAEHKPHAHGPFAAGECLACHQPHESNHEMLLRGGNGADHCFLCHTETSHALADAPYVHAPATERCTDCHDPHAADHEHALKRPIEQLCFS